MLKTLTAAPTHRPMLGDLWRDENVGGYPTHADWEVVADGDEIQLRHGRMLEPWSKVEAGDLRLVRRAGYVPLRWCPQAETILEPGHVVSGHGLAGGAPVRILGVAGGGTPRLEVTYQPLGGGQESSHTVAVGGDRVYTLWIPDNG
ncbi:hypothetical protein GCM10017673_38210 [Streptosporangium violaceochromogenes]|nr:hypothetical protein GCM10017673_38210 [Streptosporangium violaceochromogenes]